MGGSQIVMARLSPAHVGRGSAMRLPTGRPDRRVGDDGPGGPLVSDAACRQQKPTATTAKGIASASCPPFPPERR